MLACIAGIVNAVGFVAFGGFVTHVSGNATRAAVEYSEGHVLIAKVFLFSTLFFIAGACLTTIFMRGQPIESKKICIGWPLLIEAILIGAVAWVGSRHLDSGETLKISRASETWYIYTLTFSMGMQNALIRQSSGIIIRTTHMTGIVTDIGIAIGSVLSKLVADFLFHAKTQVVTSEKKHLQSVLFRLIKNLYQRFHLERFFLHISLLLSFLTGAVLGTFGYLRVGFRVLSGPLVILVLIAAFDLVSWKKRTTNNGHNLQKSR